MKQSKEELENAKRFIEDMRTRIIEEELPVVAQYLAALQKMIRNSNERIQLEALGQEQLMLEHGRIMYRVLNLIHQLLNSKVLMNLLEGHDDADTS